MCVSLQGLRRPQGAHLESFQTQQNIVAFLELNLSMEASYFLGSFEEAIIIYSNSGDMNQYVLSFLLSSFVYKNNLALDHKPPSGSGLGNPM